MMKRRLIIVTVFILAFIFTLLPISLISASPENLLENGDFSGGSTGWSSYNASFDGSTVLLDSGYGDIDYAFVYQGVFTSNKCLEFSFDVMPNMYCGSGEIYAGITLYKNGGYIDSAAYEYHQSFPLSQWSSESFTIEQLWKDFYGVGLPNFDYIEVWVEVTITDIEADFDNLSLTPYSCGKGEEVWVRTMPMTCWRVWINEDNNFQFIFWYPFKDKNFVRIYDMEGNMVFETDLPYYDPNLIVDLPDGYYMVRTYHGEEMIQEFLIGKPGPEM
jgi:hypothetical protein